MTIVARGLGLDTDVLGIIVADGYGLNPLAVVPPPLVDVKPRGNYFFRNKLWLKYRRFPPEAPRPVPEYAALETIQALALPWSEVTVVQEAKGSFLLRVRPEAVLESMLFGTPEARLRLRTMARGIPHVRVEFGPIASRQDYTKLATVLALLDEED